MPGLFFSKLTQPSVIVPNIWGRNVDRCPKRRSIHLMHGGNLDSTFPTQELPSSSMVFVANLHAWSKSAKTICVLLLSLNKWSCAKYRSGSP